MWADALDERTIMFALKHWNPAKYDRRKLSLDPAALPSVSHFGRLEPPSYLPPGELPRPA